MKLVFLFLMLLKMSFAWSDDVRIELDPKRPVVNEPFQAIFRVFTDSSDEPVINFSPSNVEVVSKNNHGTAVRTVYANGTLTTTREVTIVYELVANKEGIAYLRDIIVQVGARTVRHPSLSINVLKVAEEVQDVFVMADVPKKSVFLGEGLVVRYYLYSRVQTNNPDIKRYPKLNGFLKRFLQEPERSERVSVDGQIYVRYQIYAAKLFPEKVGSLKIDPLYLSIGYAPSRNNDPFSNFGFNRDFRNKSLNSEVINIDVKPLPENGKPQNFTGLVGKHDFQLDMGQPRLIVNEPLEIKLTVSGSGALENLEAPEIIKHPGLEEFETNGDLKIMDADQATKVFDYTFLAKENLKLPAQTLNMNYFDPNSEKYVSVPLNVSEIVVAGGSGVKQKDNATEEKKPREDRPQETIKKIQDLTGPLMTDLSGWRSILPYLNFALAGIALIVALGWVVKTQDLPKFGSSSVVPASFRKGQFNRTEFTRWVAPLILATGKSPSGIIQESPLCEETKKYFIDLLNANDYKDYSSKKTEQSFVYNAAYFKELGHYIHKVKNEDSKHITRYS